MDNRSFRGDYVPPGKTIRSGRLVDLSSVRDPEDPHLTIERLKLQVADLSRRIDMQEVQDLQDGLAQAKARVNDLERDNVDLGLRLKAADEERAALADENGKLKDELRIAKGSERSRRGKELPPVTPDVLAIATVTKERDELLKKVTDLQTGVPSVEDTPKRKRKPDDSKEG